MSEIKLLPCPFCGYHGTLNTTNIGETFYAVCMKCGSRTIDFKTTEEAIKKWNTRKPMERIIERLTEKVTLERMNKMEDRVGKRQTTGFCLGVNHSIDVVKEEGGIDG